MSTSRVVLWDEEGLVGSQLLQDFYASWHHNAQKIPERLLIVAIDKTERRGIMWRPPGKPVW